MARVPETMLGDIVAALNARLGTSFVPNRALTQTELSPADLRFYQGWHSRLTGAA